MPLSRAALALSLLAVLPAASAFYLPGPSHPSRSHPSHARADVPASLCPASGPSIKERYALARPQPSIQTEVHPADITLHSTLCRHPRTTRLASQVRRVSRSRRKGFIALSLSRTWPDQFLPYFVFDQSSYRPMRSLPCFRQNSCVLVFFGMA